MSQLSVTNKSSPQGDSNLRASIKLPDHPAFQPLPQKTHAHKFVYGYIVLLIVAALIGLGSYLYHQHHTMSDPTNTSVNSSP